VGSNLTIYIFKPWYIYRPLNIIRRLFLRKPQTRRLQKVHMAWGGQLEFDVAKSIGWGAMTTGVVDLALSEMLCHLIRPGDSVLDVGANVGGITYLMARLVGSSGYVDAYEPHPNVYNILKKNQQINLATNLNNIKLNELAVGKEQGQVVLMEDPEAESDGQASLCSVAKNVINYHVRVDKLSKMAGGREYRVMKLDVEGYELPVLEGAGNLIRNQEVENIFFEDHEGPSSSVFKHLRACGYYLYSFGWELTGVKVSPVEQGNLNKINEAPNYWAARQPLFKDFYKGWKSLRKI
jgi:FkbM family methyltransferase